MFNLLKPDPVKKLIKERNRLLEQAYKMSAVNRKKSDELMAKAEEISLQLEEMRLAANN